MDRRTFFCIPLLLSPCWSYLYIHERIFIQKVLNANKTRIRNLPQQPTHYWVEYRQFPRSPTSYIVITAYCMSSPITIDLYVVDQELDKNFILDKLKEGLNK